MDLKMTPDGDLDITDGDLSWVTELEAIVQDLTMKLSAFLAETPYDRARGVPYLQVIFAQGTSRQTILETFRGRIEAVDGITEVLELIPDINRVTRTLRLTGRARALDQEFPFDVQVTVP